MGEKTVMAPVHPGVILREEFLEPMRISEYRLAKAMHVPITRVTEITHGRRSITADTGLRLSRLFRMSEGFWTGMQDDYDRAVAKDKIGDELAEMSPVA